MEHDSMTQYDRPKIYSKLGTVPGVRAFFAGNPYKMYSKLGMSIARLYLCVHTVYTKTYILVYVCPGANAREYYHMPRIAPDGQLPI